MRQAASSALFLSLSLAVAVPAARGDDAEPASIAIPTPGGWVLKPDGETLVVSSPATAELIYIDTSKDEEIRRVKVDFQPMALALRGSTLYAAAKGSSILFALDAEDGKVKKQVKVPGSKLTRLATHPSVGPLFAANDAFEILSINPETGKVAKTIAHGNFLAVDPIKGDFLYTGSQKAIREALVLSRGPANTVRVGVAKTNQNSTIMKFGLKGKDMKPMAANGDAAINGHEMTVSPDGKQVAMAGGGGMVGGDGRRTYAIAVFDTADLKTQLGQVETGAYPADIAFHPVLDIGVAEKSGGELIVFSSRSYAAIKSISVPTGRTAPSVEPGLLTFGGRGAKILSFQPDAAVPARASRGRTKSVVTSSPEKQGQLHLIPLELSEEDRVRLSKAFPASKG